MIKQAVKVHIRRQRGVRKQVLLVKPMGPIRTATGDTVEVPTDFYRRCLWLDSARFV